MNTQYLYMLMLGARPEGRLVEQHDMFFGISNSPSGLSDAIKASWPETKGKVHIDAMRKVSLVDGYTISIIPRKSRQGKGPRLFFLNLGGYKRDEFDEFHYKMLVVAADKGEAVDRAKQTAFYQHTGFKGATSHIDDKYGVDVDEVYEITDILGKEFREQYSIDIRKASGGTPDEMQLGYITLAKLAKMTT